jgi:peptidoglycan hydrolase CwlO-like protein
MNQIDANITKVEGGITKVEAEISKVEAEIVAVVGEIAKVGEQVQQAEALLVKPFDNWTPTEKRKYRGDNESLKRQCLWDVKTKLMEKEAKLMEKEAKLMEKEAQLRVDKTKLMDKEAQFRSDKRTLESKKQSVPTNCTITMYLQSNDSIPTLQKRRRISYRQKGGHQ